VDSCPLNLPYFFTLDRANRGARERKNRKYRLRAYFLTLRYRFLPVYRHCDKR